jgi:hypothetical protein
VRDNVYTKASINGTGYGSAGNGTDGTEPQANNASSSPGWAGDSVLIPTYNTGAGW